MYGIGITVLKRNAPWGPFTREQIEEGLKRGDFTVNYLAHAPGLKEWLPLGEVLDFTQCPPGLPGVTLPPVPTPVDLPPLPPPAGQPEPSAPSPLPDPLAQMSTRPTGPPPQVRPPILPPPRRPLPAALEQLPSSAPPLVPAPETKTGPKPIPDPKPAVEPADNLEAAPFSSRAVAFFIDGAIVFLPVLVLTIVGSLCIEIPAFIRPITHEARMEEWDLLALNDRRLSWLIISLGWLYGAAFEASPSGATLGKRWMGLRVVDGRGEPILFFRAVGRNVSKYLSGGIFFLGFLMALFGPRRRALHDMMCDTRVVRA